MPTPDFYSALELTRQATDTEVKAAYRKLARLYHPDKNPNDDAETKKAKQDKFNVISEAHAVLSDKDKRERYDKSLDEGTSYDDEQKKYDEKINTLKTDVDRFFNQTLKITQVIEELKKDKHDPIYQMLLPMYEALNDEKNTFIEGDFNVENLKNLILSCETTIGLTEISLSNHERKNKASPGILHDIKSFMNALKRVALNFIKEYLPNDYKLALHTLGPTTEEKDEMRQQGRHDMESIKRKMAELRLAIPQSSETQEEEGAIVEYRGEQPKL